MTWTASVICCDFFFFLIGKPKKKHVTLLKSADRIKSTDPLINVVSDHQYRLVSVLVTVS